MSTYILGNKKHTTFLDDVFIIMINRVNFGGEGSVSNWIYDC